ncbi:MAG: DUF3126 family protein [Rhodospirillaceae bacterium]|nr:DUF3126 family protein [Rhodospirillaceae bacterium]MBT4588340.1 DUF3126 family protein [Rhodospirillaceae bacterium]MBT4940184.1 DUF3126 family protein [Rhodospirillaceae bacterium]MBT7266045.1 DUF3126 family protein [Rhodospirillaceae bacterium]
MTEVEVQKLQKYLRDKFGNENFRLVDRIKSEDSVEVYLSEEFIGTLYRDDEDGEISYDFNMAILEMDLPQ